MITLALMRHAKSSWDATDLTDFDRPLNARGQAAAPAIGHWLAQRGFQPDLVLLSSARRTRETWALMAPLIQPEGCLVVQQRALYLAEPATLLAALAEQLTGDAEQATVDRRILLLAHNPGLEALVWDFAGRLRHATRLAENSPSLLPEDYTGPMPTAGLALFEGRSTRSGFQPLAFTDFITPRQCLSADG